VADRLLLTKSDIADAAPLRDLKSRLHQLNPGAPVHEISAGESDPNEI